MCVVPVRGGSSCPGQNIRQASSTIPLLVEHAESACLKSKYRNRTSLILVQSSSRICADAGGWMALLKNPLAAAQLFEVSDHASFQTPTSNALIANFYSIRCPTSWTNRSKARLDTSASYLVLSARIATLPSLVRAPTIPTRRVAVPLINTSLQPTIIIRRRDLITF